MDSMNEAKQRILDRLTPTVVQAKLNAMAAILRFRPSMRHHLKSVHPTGVPFTFNATVRFETWDGDLGVNAIFEDGAMRVRTGPSNGADVTVRFKGPEHMRTFFTPGADTLDMLLNNEIAFAGNLSYLFKFGHMSAAVSLGGKKLAPEPVSGNGHGPGRWEDLKARPAGEPCRDRPKGEVVQLEDPYHARYTLDDFPRIKRQLWVHRTLRPQICVERPRLLTEWVLSERMNGGGREQPVLRQARAFHHIMTRKEPIIHDDDLLAGTTTSRRVGVVIYPETGGTGIWPELLTVESRELNPYKISDEDVEILNTEVFPYWMDDNIREWTRRENANPRVMQLDERFVLYFMWKTQAVSHTVADLPMILKRGLADIRDEAVDRRLKAREPEKRDFYLALEIAVEGVMDYARRLSLKAYRLAAETRGHDPQSEAKRQALTEMARTCEKVPVGPADTLREAIQATWILFLSQHQESMNAGLSIGRLDSWFEPYWKRDMRGVTDPEARRRLVEETVELTSAFMLKLTDHLPLVPNLGNRLFGGSSSDQVITLGGLTPQGRSAVVDMTWIFLKATEMLRLRDPNMNARYAPGVNSESYLRRLCEVNLLTGATPSLHNDNVMVPALERLGFRTAHARDWSATGCVEPTSCGRHYGHTNCMMFNMVAPLEMALHDGVHPVLGERIGPRTGDPSTFTTYEAFLDAYKTQLGWLLDRSVEANNMLGRAHQVLKPTPFLSAIFTGPMKAGKDLIDGGAIYNTSGTAMVGLTDVVDSLATIKTLIMERKVTDFATLLDALETDFEGHDTLHARILNKVPKFGQIHPLPRAITDDLQAFIAERHDGYAHYRGGKYHPGYWSMSNHVAFGVLSGALPSGRRRAKAFTPGLTPSHLSGAALTEQIRTIAGLDPFKMTNNIAFNVKVVPGGDDTHQQVLDRMTAYVGTYFDLGGMQMQFNVTSSDTLRDAMKNPEGYEDLIVRISGYNAYFVDLNKDLQTELIERTEHALGGR